MSLDHEDEYGIAILKAGRIARRVFRAVLLMILDELHWNVLVVVPAESSFWFS